MCAYSKPFPNLLVAPQTIVQPTVPLLKWAGGKRGLLKQILPHIGKVEGRYYEPFAGGAALFFHLQPVNAFLSDTNAELINCYIQVRDNPSSVIAVLSEYKNSEKFYYQVRASEPTDPIERAARLLYLTRLSFNSIYRVNLQGKFNVPYGQKHHLKPCSPEAITKASRALAFASLRVCNFEASVTGASKGDVIYFDPPYTVAHSNNGFIKYNETIFSWKDQERLAAVAKDLVSRGCRVLVSNAAHSSVKELYRGFECLTLRRHSNIAASRANRGLIEEVLFVG